MTTIGKLWTAGIAYVALAVGAGLSIMYNVVDTMTVRGAALDIWDVITAVAAPAIVLLMVEMFVSRIWIGQPWHIQIVRWLATVAIGGVAMRTSWTHGHDFMASRGQSADVATLWPLAIDLLAIMATALILAGRVGHVAKEDGQAVATVATAEIGRMATADEVAMARMAKAEQDGQAVAMAIDPSDEELARIKAAMAKLGHGPEIKEIKYGHESEPVATQPMSEAYMATLQAEIEAWSAGGELAITDAGQELASEAEAFLEPVKTFASTVPPEAVAMIQAWDGQDGPALDVALAERFGKSPRTARRWRSLVTGRPTSGA